MPGVALGLTILGAGMRSSSENVILLEETTMAVKKKIHRSAAFAVSVLFFFLTLGPAVAGTITYSYDEAGRLIRVDYGNSKVIAYTYDAAGNLLERKRICSGLVLDSPTPPFTVTAGSPKTVTITGCGFSDTAGVVDSVKVQRGGSPADVSFAVLSNVTISATITGSPKGKLPRSQDLIVHKSDGSRAICADCVTISP